MQIINNIEQGTNEWLKLRLGIPTASNFNKIITSKGGNSTQINAYALELASDTLILEPEESYKSSDMERGNELEPEAREAYEQYTFNSVNIVSFIKENDCGYSPDGLVGEEGLIEIKCPQKKNHTEYLSKKTLPSAYKAQVQGGLMISGRKWCDFISYNPNFEEKNRLMIIRVFRDEEFIYKLKEGIKKVNDIKNEILNKIV